jgi:tRNA(Ile)-lysidine synthase
MRNLLALLAQEGLQAGDLVRLAERSARAEAALESCAQAYFARLRAEAGEGRYACDLTPLRDAPREFLLRLIVQEMARVGGGAVRLDRAERLTEWVEAALSAGAPLKSSLAGALLQLDAAGGLLISREPPRRTETRKEPGEASILFDAED